MERHLRRSPLAQASFLTLLLPVLLAAAPYAPIAAADDSAGFNACRYGNWSRATWLEAGTPLLAATRVQLLTMSSATSAAFVVGVGGFLAIEFPQYSAWPTQWPPQLRAIRLDGTRLNMPLGGFWYAYPRSVIDNRGTLHVLWGEPDERVPRSPSLLRGVLPEIRSVWHATFRAGSWSRAERVYSGEQLKWGEHNTTRLILDDENRLHIAFTSEGFPASQVIYLSADGSPMGRWHATVQGIRTSMGYLDLAVGPHGQAAMAFISGVAMPVARPSVLFLIRSSDGGKSWSPPITVTTSAEDPAIEPHLFFDRNADLRLVWVKQEESTFAGGTLLHTLFAGTDRGPAHALPLPPDIMTSGMQAAIDSCGTVHVFTQAYPDGTSHLWYTRLTRDGWSPWTQPFDVAGAHASIVANRAQVHVVWNAGSLPKSPDGALLSGLVHATLPILGPLEPERRE